MTIKIIQAEPEHLKQLAELLMTTGYDRATAKYNILNLDVSSYIQKYKLVPALPFTKVVVDDSNQLQVLGMIISASLNDINNSATVSYSHPKTKSLFKKIHDICDEHIPQSYYISRLAVNASSRGKGIGKVLLEYAEQNAKELGFNKITLMVWNCQIDAINLYLKFGMEIKNCYVISEDLPYSTLMYLEKNLDNQFEKNYFETERFLKLELI